MQRIWAVYYTARDAQTALLVVVKVSQGSIEEDGIIESRTDRCLRPTNQSFNGPILVPATMNKQLPSVQSATLSAGHLHSLYGPFL